MMKLKQEIGVMLTVLATFLLVASLLAPISTTNMYLLPNVHQGGVRWIRERP